jgi:hypothetical protein
MRRWTSTDGITTEAALRELTSTHVVLERKDGKKLRIPLNRLSRPDQEFLRQHWRASRRT